MGKNLDKKKGGKMNTTKGKRFGIGFILGAILAIGPVAFGAVIGEDTVTIGKRGSSADKTVKMGNGQIKWNQAAGKMTFSNDNGGSFKNFGSGSGGGSGINFLADNNFDFEGGLTNWTASSAPTLTAATTSPNLLYGGKSAVFNSTGAAQTVDSVAISMTASAYQGAAGGNGYASCQFKTTATDYKIQAVTGSTVLGERTIGATSSAMEQGFYFPFPTSGSVFLRIVSQSNAADLAVDNCFLGSASFAQVGNAEEVGSIKYSNCSGNWTLSSGSYNEFAALSGCTYTTTGIVEAPTGAFDQTPAFKMSSVKPGKYVLEYSGMIFVNSAQDGHFRFSDGTVPALEAANIYSGAGQVNAPGFKGSFTYTTPQSNIHFRAQAWGSGGATVGIGASLGASIGDAVIKVYRFPLESEQAVKMDTIGWKVDANIGGANPDLGIVAVSSYTEITNSGLDIVQNTGSIGVEIPCSGTNPSTGLTCAAGSESVGIVFTVPAAGDIEVCGEFTNNSGTAAASAVSDTFHWVETPNNAQTILQEGKGRANYENSTGATLEMAHMVCGTFSFASAGKKTLRMMYEQAVIGTVSQSLLVLDRNTSKGQRDMHITVRPLTQQVPAPVLVGGVTSMSQGVERFVRASVGTASCTSSPCTIVSQSGGVASITRSSAGRYVVYFDSGLFSAKPSCVANSNNYGAYNTYVTAPTNLVPPSATVWAFDTVDDSGVTADSSFDIICIGPR